MKSGFVWNGEEDVRESKGEPPIWRTPLHHDLWTVEYNHRPPMVPDELLAPPPFTTPIRSGFAYLSVSSDSDGLN